MIEYVLMLYWLPNMQPFDYTLGGKRPPVTFTTVGACEEFRLKIDPRFMSSCEPRDGAELSGPGPAGDHDHLPGNERK